MSAVRTAAALAAALVLAACGAGTPSPSASSATPAGPTPVVPGGEGPWLRADLAQALPPLAVFARLAEVVITADGTVVRPGPVPEAFPGPAVAPLVGRTVTAAGRDAILARAAELGLLGPATDFTGGAGLPGGVTGRLLLTVDGKPRLLVGDPSRLVRCGGTRCIPDPGTPEAFAAFWQQLLDLDGWLAAELGPEAPWRPAGYAVLAGPPAGQLGGPFGDWPLAVPLATGGADVGGGWRCLTVAGGDADVLRAALAAATEATGWLQDPASSTLWTLRVRPLLPGEDACRDVFGVGG